MAGEAVSGGSKKKYHRADIVQAAVKRFGKKWKIALEELPLGKFRIRTVGGPMDDLIIDGIRHLIERDVQTLAGPFDSLAEIAQHFGVKPS